MFWTKTAYAIGLLTIAFGTLLISLGIYFEPEQAAYYFNKTNGEIIDRGLLVALAAIPIMVLAEISLNIDKFVNPDEQDNRRVLK